MSDSETRPFRSIIKDGQTTNDPTRTQVEVAVWEIQYAEVETKPDPRASLVLKVDGKLQYDTILAVVLGRREVDGYDPLTASELSARTESPSYADARGGRSESTVKGYLSNDRLTRLPSSHPVKRVLRREIRSNKLGHFSEDTTSDELPEPIDMERLSRAFLRARTIVGENLTFVSATTTQEAVEDNKLIDEQDIRVIDEIDEILAAALVEKGDKQYEYRIDLSKRKLEAIDGWVAPA